MHIHVSAHTGDTHVEIHIKKYSLRVDSWDVKQNIWKWQAELLLLLHQIIPFHHIPGKSLFLKF